MPFEVFIFGHSFVRRLTDIIESDPKLKIFGLDLASFRADCFGLGGLKLSQRARLHLQDQLMAGKDLVILDVASNDLCDYWCQPEQLALDLVSFSAYLVEGFSVKQVAISPILLRGLEPFEGYNDNVVKANVAIQHVFETCDSPVLFWKHRGLWNPRNDICD